MLDPIALSVLTATPASLTALVAAHDEAVLLAPGDDGWSVRHVMAHILDVDTVIFDDRVSRILIEERPFIRSIDPLARLVQRRLLDRPVADMRDELARRRPAEVATLAELNADALARAGDHDEVGEITVSDLIHQWAYHDLMHVKQAASIFQAPLMARMGNTCKFYDL